MKKALLFALSLAIISFVQAQKNAQKITAYAITGVQKGNTTWTEVRLVDLLTGEELQSVYASNAEAQILNARTGKPVAKRDAVTDASLITESTAAPTQVIERNGDKTIIYTRKISTSKPSYDAPFATNSAACAFDKKNNRLYYTPMGINQLRYIDLKAKSPKVFYFEDEAFGVVKGRYDVASQITRMVIAGDGKGYALSNDGNHLIQFTAKKKPEIKDMGALIDDATNGRYSIHSASSWGGDMIADKEGNLYVITANAAVYKISPQTMMASFVGKIKGLPRGYSTNGAVAEGDSKVIVSSSSNTAGYYRFDLNTLESEKISGATTVFNASDLASATLAFEKKKDEKPIEEKEVVMEAASKKVTPLQDVITANAIAVYPNPVTDGYFKLSFADQKPGRYQIQFMDIAGKMISVQAANINNKLQVEEFRLPQQVASGKYLVKVISEDGTFTTTKKIIVQ